MTNDETAIRSFEVDVDRDDVADLNRRLDAARWPDQLPDAGWDYGTERSTLQDLCSYWRADFDWDAFAADLNRFDQSVTVVDGQRIHFYHVTSPVDDATPLLLSHGWPGSVVEFLDVLGPLSDPAAHGGDPADAFHVVAPSLPGYGFSGPTADRGWDVPRIADAFATLMDRLGYEQFVAQGGDWGALVAACLGATYPERLDAIHTNMLFVTPDHLDDPWAILDDEHLSVVDETARFQDEEAAYQEIQGTKPQTLAYGLTDSPVGLAGWLLEKFRTWTDCDGDVLEYVGRDRLLANVSVYWLTRTINSSMRLYYETDLETAIPTDVPVPTGHARYPAEIIETPRPWAEEIYDVVHWREMPEGGHFAAMEVPDLFVDDLREFVGTYA